MSAPNTAYGANSEKISFRAACALRIAAPLSIVHVETRTENAIQISVGAMQTRTVAGKLVDVQT